MQILPIIQVGTVESKIKACRHSHIAEDRANNCELNVGVTNMISTGEAVLRLLAEYDVDTIFGIPGVHTLDFCRGLGDDAKIRHIHARNEMGAGFMADGYARSNGKPGVCLTISGPGVTNAATPLGQSYADSVPLLLISAEAHSDTLEKGHGTLHEVTDLNAVTRPLCALSACARKSEDIPQLMARAFSIFASQRPRPVHISIPIDVLANYIEYDWKAIKPATRAQADTELLEQAAEIISTAENPYILIGGGAYGSDIQTLAERAGATVIFSNAGKGIMPESHPLSLGGSICRSETKDLLKDADLVFAIGTELSETDNYVGKLEFECPLIRVDIDPNKMIDLHPANLAIIGDAAPAVEKLTALLPDTTPDTSGKQQVIAKTKKAIEGTLNVSEEKHVKILGKLRETLSSNTIFMSDATQMTYTASFSLQVDEARCSHYAAGYCALGFAFPNAIGAKLAHPDTPVIAIAGDSGTMFTVQEFVTAAELNLPLPLILWHNDGYKQIRDDMREANVPRIAVDGLSPDYMALAKAMHCNSVQPASMLELGEAVTAALSADRPTIILVREDSAWLE